ncbi:MAG: nucleotidyltransferase family protein [Thermoanaerobaculia bacterium]|nr:nucleotidyltransferase family protein [Thermoanaerobaculia bacterium]
MNTYTVIVPAAGASRRMGRPKLLLPYRDRAIIEWTLDALSVESGARIVLVVHATDIALQRAVAHRAQVQWVANPEPERGMLSSVLVGLDAARSRPTSHLLVCPGDLPDLRAATVTAVLHHHRTRGAKLVVPTYHDRRGHPLLIDAELAPRIRGLDPNIGLRQITQDPKYRVEEVPVDDPGCVRDVDTPADYHTLDQALERPET